MEMARILPVTTRQTGSVPAASVRSAPGSSSGAQGGLSEFGFLFSSLIQLPGQAARISSDGELPAQESSDETAGGPEFAENPLAGLMLAAAAAVQTAAPLSAETGSGTEEDIQGMSQSPAADAITQVVALSGAGNDNPEVEPNAAALALSSDDALAAGLAIPEMRSDEAASLPKAEAVSESAVRNPAFPEPEIATLPAKPESRNDSAADAKAKSMMQVQGDAQGSRTGSLSLHDAEAGNDTNNALFSGMKQRYGKAETYSQMVAASDDKPQAETANTVRTVEPLFMNSAQKSAAAAQAPELPAAGQTPAQEAAPAKQPETIQITQDAGLPSAQRGAHTHEARPAAAAHRPELQDMRFHLLRRDESTFSLTIEPEGLGPMDIRLALDHGVISAQIHAVDDRTRELVMNNLDNLASSLRQEGLELGNLSVAGGQRDQGRPSGEASAGSPQETRNTNGGDADPDVPQAHVQNNSGISIFA